MEDSKAKTFRGWLLGAIARTKHSGNVEMRIILEEIYNKYNSFQTEEEVEIKRWKGKSSFELIEMPDKYIVVKYQRPARGDEPRPIRTEITRHEMAVLYSVICDLWAEEPLKTKIIAQEWSNRMGYRFEGLGPFWQQFFTDRRVHNKFTLALGILEKKKKISYVGGLTNLLKK